MFDRVRQLLEMIRFSHTVFALPFALLAAVMAWTTPTRLAPVSFEWRQLLGIVVAMVGARSASMAFNRLVDQSIDARNPRTANRHLPAGMLSRSSVIRFTIVSSMLFFFGAALFWPNYLPLVFAAPVLGVLLGYSYAKRFTSLAHFWLGAALMLAPVCAWIAIRGDEVIARPGDLVPSIVLGMAVLFWVSGFDIIYACQDYDFDRQNGLRSMPVRLGISGALRLAAACHLVTVGLLAALPWTSSIGGPPLGLGWLYGLGVVAIATLLCYEHMLVRPDDLARVGIAFFHVNAVISLGLFLVGSVDLLWV